MPALLPLFTVTDRFQIEGLGCVLVPGLPAEPGAPNVSRGTRIRLRTPQGREIDTFVKDLEMINFGKRPGKFCIPVSLPKNISPADVPVGTEVFLLAEDLEGVK